MTQKSCDALLDNLFADVFLAQTVDKKVPFNVTLDIAS